MSDKHPPRSFSRRDDERLAIFLQDHCPSAPPAPRDAEERLLHSLDRLPIPSAEFDPVPAVGLPDRPRWHLWAIPGAIAASVLLAWGSYRVSAPQIAERRATELEEFLVRSWDGFVPAPTATLRSYEAEWLLFGPEAAPVETTAAATLSAPAEPASTP